MISIATRDGCPATEAPSPLGHLPLAGRWVPFTGNVKEGVLDTAPLGLFGFGNGVRAAPVPGAEPNLIRVKPIPFPCQAETRNKAGAAQPYSCLAEYKDNFNNGHPVLLRQGRTGPAAFGLLHAVQDHNVDEHAMATVIVNNTIGLPDTRPTGGPTKYIYGATFMAQPSWWDRLAWSA